MEDKLGSTVAAKIQYLMDIYKLQATHFFHVCTDGGGEITGAQRSDGMGDTGMFKMLFSDSCFWTWCCKHLLNIVFGDTDLTLIYDNLNTVSKFLRCANRYNKLKPHISLVAKHNAADCPEAHTLARQRIERLGDAITEAGEVAQKVRVPPHHG